MASITVVGAANIDILSFAPIYELQSDSYPGEITFSHGGVGRNIAEILAALGLKVSLVTVLGADKFGTELMEHAQLKGIDLTHSLISDAGSTPCYSAMMSSRGELLCAVSDMKIIDQLSPEYLLSKRDIIASTDICVLDTNLRRDSIETMLREIRGPRYVVDTVSGAKSSKVRNVLERIHLVKTNETELCNLLGYYSIRSVSDNLSQAGTAVAERGLNKLFVSRGSAGLWYMEASEGKMLGEHTLNAPSSSKIINTSGAGDAMCAGIVFALYHNKDVHELARYGMAASMLAVEDKATVAQNLSVATLEQRMKEIQ